MNQYISACPYLRDFEPPIRDPQYSRARQPFRVKRLPHPPDRARSPKQAGDCRLAHCQGFSWNG